jgi:hypothetical protein
VERLALKIEVGSRLAFQLTQIGGDGAMRQWICLVVVALGLGLVASGWQMSSGAALAAQFSPSATTGLITHVQDVDGKALRVIVIDPTLRVMSVYDISRETGEIQPKSIRNLNADMQMLEFNSGAPSPADIQKTLERK